MTWHVGLAFGFGLLIGSFLNVVIHRLPRMIQAEITPNAADAPHYNLNWPASHCPSCQTPLKAWHNIPVFSYVFLKGRCGFCKQTISPRYPIIELATALIWALCALHWGVNATGISWAGFVTVLLALSVIDWQTTLLPDDLTQTLVWSGLICSSLGWVDQALSHSVWGAAMGYASLWTIATAFERITGKQGMGAGDFKLLAGLGAWLGPLALLPVVMLASIGGACVGLFFKFTNRLSDDGYVPFGPFLAAAGVTVAVVGVEVIAISLGW